jgi:hypothetical protein
MIPDKRIVGLLDDLIFISSDKFICQSNIIFKRHEGLLQADGHSQSAYSLLRYRAVGKLGHRATELSKRPVFSQPSVSVSGKGGEQIARVRGCGFLRTKKALI